MGELVEFFGADVGAVGEAKVDLSRHAVWVSIWLFDRRCLPFFTDSSDIAPSLSHPLSLMRLINEVHFFLSSPSSPNKSHGAGSNLQC